MRLSLLAVGKIKDRNLSALCAEFEKRLRRYVRLAVVEVRDVRGVDVTTAMSREAKALENKLPAGATVVALTREGDAFSSTELASWLDCEANASRSSVAFCIGGPSGLESTFASKAKLRLSLSRMTLTHEMARLFLLEQLYRAMTIRRGEPYHRGG